MGSPKKPCCLTVKYLQHRSEGSLMLKSTRLLQYMIPKHVIAYMIYTQGSNFRAGFSSTVTLLHKNSLNHNLTLKYRTTWCTYSRGEEGEGKG